ncbi:MAG TPA: hypothetical protein VE133_00120 [Candidatus Sulfotelmatobacter sp.]|nr:hypothetical protein [Candidatus Sulfotelmatobacter sp.]
MIEAIEPGIPCPACGSMNDASATRCAACGVVLIVESERGPALSDDDPSLRTVDPERRVEVAHFEIGHGEEAEIACGLLRANGIACELGNPVLPGLPAEQKLWVNSRDAKLARALLVPGAEEDISAA